MARQRDIIDIEMWRDIPGFGGVYQASTHGRIRRLPRIIPSKNGSLCWAEFLILKGKARRVDGYVEVQLLDANGRQFKKCAHWWVCRTFHGEQPSPAHEVAHGDGVRSNNRADNLRWATRKENAADRIRHGTHINGERHRCAKLTNQQVREIRASHRGFRGEGVRLAEEYGVNRALISRIIKRKSWNHI